MEIIGFSNPENTVIRAIIDGVDLWIPDDMSNKYRRMIWDEWEMAPAPEGTPDKKRVRVNTIPSYAAPSPPVPSSISRRQFFQVLAVREIITRQEALDAVATGAIPEAMEQLIQMLADEDLQWNARMVISGATDFERSNWFVDVFGQLRNMTSGEIDQLWTDGHALS